MKINKVCILGAGTLGSRIALQSVISGFEVRVYDIQESAFEASRKMMAKVLKQIKMDASIIDQILFTTDPMKAVLDADIISESVTEDLALKQQVWAQFGAIAPEKTIFN